MKILVLNYEYPPVGGGGGYVSADICEVLTARGHEVLVLTARARGTLRDEVRDGYRIHRVPTGRRSYFKASFLAMLAYVVSAILPGYRILRDWKPDVIHAHFAVPTGALAFLLSKLTGTPYVLTLHLGDVPGGVPDKTAGWFRWVYAATPTIYDHAAAVVAVSEHTRNLALKHYPIDIRVIPNGVDLAELNPSQVNVGHPPQIIFAGRFVEQKNTVGLVHILAEMNTQDWRCTMIGDGVLFEPTKLAIEEHKLQDRVYLVGWLSPEEVVEQMRQSDILFMPSKSEGMPVVGVQAMALGLAIIASRVGGFPEMVEEDKNGNLFDPKDADGMKVALEQLISDTEKLEAYRKHSQDLAKRFDLKIIGEEYEEVFLRSIEK